MRLLTPLAVFVLAILAGHSNSLASEGPSVPPEDTQQVSSQTCETCPVGGHHNGFDQYRRSPDLGGPHSAGYGFKHFAQPMQNYTLWHRPKAATLTKAQRCAIVDFRPRGYGNLFAAPCDSFRMDYTPYVLHPARSQFGPAYLLRQRNLKCDDCAH